MAYPQIRSVGTVVSGTGTLSVPLPVGWQENDILVLIAETANQTPTGWVPSGWISLTSTGSGTAGGVDGVRLLAAYKRAGALENNVAFSGGIDHLSACIVAVQGVTTVGDPLEFTPIATSPVGDQSTVTWGTGSTSFNDSLVLFFLAGNRDASSTSEVGDLVNSNLVDTSTLVENWHALGQGGGIFLASGRKLEAGSIGTTTASITPQTFVTLVCSLIPSVETVLADSAAVAYTVYNSVEQDSPSFVYSTSTPAVLANSWFDRLTESKNTWYEIETYNESSSTQFRDFTYQYNVIESKEQDVSPSYNLLSSREIDLSVTYTLQSATGIIGGGGPLPYGSAFRVHVDTYNVYAGTAVRDLVPYYQVTSYRERNLDLLYNLSNSVSKDAVVTYVLGGTVETDLTPTYQVLESISQDLVPTYTVFVSVAAILVTYYTVSASHVLQDLDVEYNLVESLTSDVSLSYKVLNEVTPLDLVVTYKLYGEGVLQDLVVTYVLNPSNVVEKTLAPVWNIQDYRLRQVPNVVGLTLKEGKAVLMEHRLKVGKVSYGT